MGAGSWPVSVPLNPMLYHPSWLRPVPGLTVQSGRGRGNGFRCGALRAARRCPEDHGGQVMGALTALTCPAVTVAVATPGWQPGRLAVMV